MEKLWNANYIKVLLVNFTIFFSFYLITPLLPIYLYDTFRADKDTIGVVLFGYAVLGLVSRLFSGYIVDRFNRKSVLLFCFFIFTLFFVGYVVAGSLLVFAIVRTLHGVPFGTTTVANSTVAIDVLPSSRRNEGIGFYGLSNNLASALSPSLAIFLYNTTKNFELLFWIAMASSVCGLAIAATIKTKARPVVKDKARISLDRFFLLRGWSAALTLMCFSFGYGILSTYVAIYGRDELGIENGSSLFFLLFSIGLIASRLQGSKALREGRIAHNAAVGIIISLSGYLLFAALHAPIGYYGAALVIGLGNGHMYPAYQNMFIAMAPNSQRGTANSSILVSWDVGVGMGILLGGIVSEYLGYGGAFWMAFMINAVGVLGFYLHTRGDFERKRLR